MAGSQIGNPKKDALVAALIATRGNIKQASILAGISEPTAHAYLKDQEVVDAFEHARQVAARQLIEEAVRRAKKGSDVLVMFSLKALMPELFDDNVRKAKWLKDNEMTDPDAQQPVTINLVRGEEPARLRKKE